LQIILQKTKHKFIRKGVYRSHWHNSRKNTNHFKLQFTKKRYW